MLQAMRKIAKSWVSSVFLGALALSFALWGINDIFRGTVPDTVATIGSISIPVGEFRRQYQSVLREESVRQRHQLTTDEARAQGLGQAALDQMISRVALDNLVGGLGLTVSDAEVAKQIQSAREFFGPLGTFDKPTFLAKIEQAGFNEQSFIDTERHDLAREQLIAPMELGLQVPDTYAAAWMTAAQEHRAVDYFIVQPDTVGAIPAPGDAILSAYVKKHPERYSTPEYHDVSYAWLAPEDVAGKQIVTPEQIKQVYDQRKDTYVIAEKRDVEQIPFASEADARTARTRINSGESFASVATSRGLKPADLALGTIVQDDLDKDRGAAVFALPPDGVTQPVKGPTGWFLLHVTKIAPGSTRTLADATPEIRKGLMDQLVSSALGDVANKYQDLIAHGADIKEAAQQAEMHFGHVAAMDAKGLGPDGKPTAAPDNDEFRAQVFKMDIGEPGDAFSAKDGHLFAIKVNGVTPPKLKGLDSVRAQALADWTAEQRAMQLRNKVRQLVAEGNRLQDISDAARSLGVKVAPSKALDRATADDTFSPVLIKAIFDTPPGQVTSGPQGKGDGIVVARVTGIVHPAAQPGSAMTQRVKAELSQTVAQDITLSLANAAKKEQGVTITPKLVDQVTGGEGS